MAYFAARRGDWRHILQVASSVPIPPALAAWLPADVVTVSAETVCVDACILDTALPMAEYPPDTWYFTARNGEFGLAACKLRPCPVPDFEAETGYQLVLPEAYSPVDHAQRLWEGGRRDAALALLAAVADWWGEDSARQRAVALQGQRLRLQALQASRDDTERLLHFSRGQIHFFRAVYVDPASPDPYEIQAEAWRALGNTHRAHALLHAYRYAFSQEQAPSAPVVASPGVPVLELGGEECLPLRRILLWTIPGYDPMMDALYDGFVQRLTPRNVDTFPYKAALHEGDAATADQYPLAFDHPGQPCDVEELCARLRRREYDLVLYGDVPGFTPEANRQRIVEAMGETPCAIVDGWDDPADQSAMLRHRLGATNATPCFKRERMRGVAYGPNVVPLTLCYPDSYVPERVPARRTQSLFWAGNRFYGMRRLYLVYLEAALNRPLGRSYDQAGYRQALSTAHLGLSLCGFGYDTVRYYEVPAHGTALLAERPPIVIPNDFEDGKNALLFDDLEGLVERLEWAFTHPQALRERAEAGRAHCLAHHTASRRVDQLLRYLGFYAVSP